MADKAGAPGRRRKRPRPPKSIDTAPGNADLQAGHRQTTWKAVTKAYPSVLAAYPSVPRDHNIAFLASKPALDGALAHRETDRIQFQLPARKVEQKRTLKAVLAQAAGLPAKTPCTNCAAGNGLWASCNRAPARPNELEDLLAGQCPSCFYDGGESRCQRSPVPSTPASSGDELAEGEHTEPKKPSSPPPKRRKLTSGFQTIPRDVKSRPPTPRTQTVREVICAMYPHLSTTLQSSVWKSGPFQYMVDSPAVRSLVQNTRQQKESDSALFHLGEDHHSMHTLTALLSQIGGVEPTTPCESCSRGLGAWDGCVISPPGLHPDDGGSSCANCLFRGTDGICKWAKEPGQTGSEPSTDPPLQGEDITTARVQRKTTSNNTPSHRIAGGLDGSSLPRVRSDLSPKPQPKARRNNTPGHIEPGGSSAHYQPTKSEPKEIQCEQGEMDPQMLRTRIDQLELERDEYRAGLQKAKAKIAEQGQRILLYQTNKLATQEDDSTAPKRDLQRKIEKITMSLRRVRDEHAEEKKSILENVAGLEADLARMRDAESRNQSLDHEMANLTSRNTELETTVDSLKKTIVDLEECGKVEKQTAAEAHHEQIKKAKHQVKTLTLAHRARIEILEQRLDEFQTAAGQGKVKLREATIKHQNASQTLRDEVAHANQEIDRLLPNVQRLTAKVAELEHQLEDKEIELQQHREAKMRLDQAIEQLNAEMSRKKSEEKVVEQDLASLKVSESKMQQDVQQLNEKITKLEAAGVRTSDLVDSLHSQNDHLREKASTLRQSLMDVQNAGKARLDHEVGKMQSGMIALQQQGNELEQQQLQVRAVFAGMKQRAQALEAARAQLQRENEEQRERMRVTEDEASEAATTINHLRERLHKNKAALDTLNEERVAMAEFVRSFCIMYNTY